MRIYKLSFRKMKKLSLSVPTVQKCNKIIKLIIHSCFQGFFRRILFDFSALFLFSRGLNRQIASSVFLTANKQIAVDSATGLIHGH